MSKEPKNKDMENNTTPEVGDCLQHSAIGSAMPILEVKHRPTPEHPDCYQCRVAGDKWITLGKLFTPYRLVKKNKGEG